MSDIAIRVQGLEKAYAIWKRPRSRLTGALAGQAESVRWLPAFVRDRLRAYRASVGPSFKALHGIDFVVPKGQTVGIVGRNGSGKSTLLKIITGVLRPTSGTVEVHGRVAALLELGTGFNPEFTGRENVRLSASIIGMSRKQIAERFDEIAEFADIGQFIDQPVKTYSSGMLVRLGFAVHTVLDPEILIVDEALAVGDQSFRRKCFARLERLREAGTTILFVSHDLGSVLNLTRYALFLHRGRVVMEGSPKRIVEAYEKFSNAPQGREEAALERILAADKAGPGKENPDPETVPETVDMSFDPALKPKATFSYDEHGAVIHDVRVCDEEGRTVNQLYRGRRYCYRYRVRFEDEGKDVSFAMLIKTLKGQHLGGARSLPIKQFHERMAAGSVHEVSFAFDCLLTPGLYYLNAGVEGEIGGRRSYLHRLVDAAVFRVLREPNLLPTGIVDFKIQPTVERIEEVVAG